MKFGLCLLAILATTRRGSSSSSSAVLAASLAQNRNNSNSNSNSSRNHKESHTPNTRAAYLSKLMSHATWTRTSLPEEDRNEPNEEPLPNQHEATKRFLDQDFVVGGGGLLDLSELSLEFGQCQSVQAYNFDSDFHRDRYSSIDATQQFAIFRLCPSDVCSATDTATATATATTRSSSSSWSSSCLQSGNFGEYAIGLEDYLRATVDYQRELQDQMCDACWDECFQDDDDEEEEEEIWGANDDGFRSRSRSRRRHLNHDCDSCYDECMKIENMEDNGYIDATQFLTCQMIYDPIDDDDDPLYAGPVCMSNGNRFKTGIFRDEAWKTDGSKIKIGVFSDEDCTTLDPSKDVEDYLLNGDGYYMKLSYHLLKKATSPRQCIPCSKGRQQQQQQQQETHSMMVGEHGIGLEMCNELYYASAKCETPHGFQAGMATDNGSLYSNQLAQEDTVCDFVASLTGGKYSEGGEIWIRAKGSNTTMSALAEPLERVTTGQWIALGILTMACLGLAGYACRSAIQLSKLPSVSDDFAAARRASASSSSLKVAVQEDSQNETAEEDGSNTMEAASLLAKDERAEGEDDGGDHDGDGDP